MKNSIKKTNSSKATYNYNVVPVFESNFTALTKLTNLNFWGNLFRFDKTKAAILASTPLVSTIDCAVTYPAVAAVGLMQSKKIRFIHALNMQTMHPNGLYGGLANFLLAKHKSRATGCLLGSSLIGDKPNYITISIAALISGLSETFFTNKDICRSRLLVTEKQTYIKPDILSKCSKAVFPLHAVKNIVTIYAALSIFNLTPKKYTEQSPFCESTTKGIFTGVGIMILQLFGASQLDTAMTLLMKEKYHNPKSQVQPKEIITSVLQQSFSKNISIACVRAGIFGLSYTITFTIIGKIKETLQNITYKSDENDETKSHRA